MNVAALGSTHGRARELNRIILLTPNEGLSQQHLREFEEAGIEAEIFNKDGRGLFAGQAVEILEVTKLKEEMGEKTVAVEGRFAIPRRCTATQAGGSSVGLGFSSG